MISKSYSHFSYKHNRIDGVIFSVLASSVVDRGFEPMSGQTKYYNIGIWCFFAKQAALRRKNKDLLVRNQDNVSDWSDMTTCGLLFQWASTIKNPSERVGLVQNGYHYHIIECNL